MKSLLQVSLVSLCFATQIMPVAAASLCYPPAAAEADASLQYHAHLRIVGLSCGGFSDYQAFTTANSGLLQSYQDQLLAFYRSHGKGNAEQRLHARETEIQNQESLIAARRGTALFCQEERPGLAKAAGESQSMARGEIARLASTAALPARRCTDQH